MARVDILLFGGLSILAACHSSSNRELWIVPAGYTGWLRLDYSVPGAAPLPVENGWYVVRMPRTGRLATSSTYKHSLDRNSYYFEDSYGRHKLMDSPTIIQEYAVQNAYSFGKGPLNAVFPQPECECVFVGTRSDFESNGRNCAEWPQGQSEPAKLKRHVRVP